MIWSTVGTNRVCSRCLELKDKVVGYTDEEVTLPPLHPRCRCAIKYREVDSPRASNWRRQEHFSTSEENLKATNPNYNLGAAFQNNCQKCVPTYEMRMRGYDVTARPTFDDMFVAENRNGAIHFLDPQTGESDVEYYFDNVKDGLTKLLRMDNLEPDEKNIKRCCKEVKRNDKS